MVHNKQVYIDREIEIDFVYIYIYIHIYIYYMYIYIYIRRERERDFHMFWTTLFNLVCDTDLCRS